LIPIDLTDYIISNLFSKMHFISTMVPYGAEKSILSSLFSILAGFNLVETHFCPFEGDKNAFLVFSRKREKLVVIDDVAANRSRRVRRFLLIELTVITRRAYTYY